MKETTGIRLPISIYLQSDHRTCGYCFFYFFKRTADLVFSLAVILILYPICLPLLFLLIKTDSKGRLFFIQKRVGLHGRVFHCLKFRTMTNHGWGKQVTKAGKFLRNTGLDELPQFINVLKGEMSIIGPRPYSLEDHEQFSDKVENYHLRQQVKPGITGLAQVYGYKGSIHTLKDLKERTAIDLIYVNTRSLLLDGKIILLTIRLILTESINALWKK